MGCINKNLKDNQRLIQDFSETRVNQLFDEYFQDENPSYGEFISNPNVKEALGIIPISKVKSEIGKAFGKEISSRELKILKKSISNINDKLLGHSYKLFNIKQKGESDNYSWGLRKINSNINIQAKIDRLKQRINTGKQIRNLEDNQFNFPDVNSNLNQGLQWLKEVNPNVQPEIVQGLIDGIANGSYNSNLDLITLSEEFANKKTVKHEFLHKVLASLPFEQRESILNEASKKYGIARNNANTSVSTEDINETNKKLEIFLKQFGFTTEQLDDLKEITGYSIIGATDFLEKTIFVQKQNIDKAYTKEAAYSIFNLLGRKNLLRKDLIASIHLIDNYDSLKSKYTNSKLSDYKIRELIAVDYLQSKLIDAHKETLDTDNKATSKDVTAKSKLEYTILKIKKWWSEILRKFFKSYKKGYIENVFNQIANDVISNNTRLFNLSKDVSYNKMELTGKNKEVDDNLVKLGAINSGSYALNRQGNLTRESINDLDYFLPYSIKDDFIKNVIKKYPQAIFSEPYSGVMGNRSLTLSLKIDDVKIDFFLPTSQEESDKNKIIIIDGIKFHHWKNIFDAKVRIGSQKHLSDLAGFVPFNREWSVYNVNWKNPLTLKDDYLNIVGQRHYNFDFIQSKFNKQEYSSNEQVIQSNNIKTYWDKNLEQTALNYFRENNISFESSIQYQDLLSYFNNKKDKAIVAYYLTFSENFKKFYGNINSRRDLPSFIINSINGNYSKNSILLDENNEPVVFYHGAGTKFDKFSKDYFLSGEGAMAYGAGFYSTNYKPTADNYRDTSKAAYQKFQELLKEENEELLKLIKDIKVDITEDNINLSLQPSGRNVFFGNDLDSRTKFLELLGLTETKALYVALTNPLYWQKDISQVNKSIIESHFNIKLKSNKSGEIYRELEKTLKITDKELSARLYQIGIDGVINIAGGGQAVGGFSHKKGEIHVIFFEPVQAKAVNNSGLFSLNNENMYDPIEIKEDGIARGESKTTTKYSQAQQNEINYALKAVDILQSTKGDEVFRKGDKNNWSIDKILQELQIPKDQQDLIKSFNTRNREEIITNLLAGYSYTIEINTAKTNRNLDDSPNAGDLFNYGNDSYTRTNGGNDFKLNGKSISEDKLPDFVKNYFEETKVQNQLLNTQHYSKLTVPGGTNYTENEIATPTITPSIKGHAQFSTDNGIGWFRSDESLNDKPVWWLIEPLGDFYKRVSNPENADYYNEAIKYEFNTEQKAKEANKKYSNKWDINYQDITRDGSKTRRILEVQSDLFQKGRDKESLILNEDEATKKKMWEFKTLLKNRIETLGNFKRLHPEQVEEIKKREKEIEGNKAVIEAFEKPTQNQFLQLLNKDNNWVTFFVKSIIQDSAKKGYEKVLFPTGNTASKVEGHTTLEEFKKQKEDRIKELEKQLKNPEYVVDWLDTSGYSGQNIVFKTEQEALDYVKTENAKLPEDIEGGYTSLFNGERLNREINQLKQELERVEGSEGFGALKPIYNFYENTVTNILNKTYGKENVKLITDEYGNTWNEIDLSSEKVKQQTDKILFQSPKLQYTGDLAIEEKIAEEAENSKDEIVAKTPLQKFIQSIRNLLRNIFREKDKISRLLRDMNQGRLNSNNRNTTNQDIKYQLSKEQSDAIDNVFDENPELADAIYESLGFGNNIPIPINKEIEFLLLDEKLKINLKDITLEEEGNVDLNSKDKWNTFAIKAKNKKLGYIQVRYKDDNTVKIGLSALYEGKEEIKQTIISKILDLINNLFKAKKVEVSDKKTNVNAGKGVGKLAYELLAVKLKQDYQKDLVSDTSRTDYAENLWKSFEKQGKANIIGKTDTEYRWDYYYKFNVHTQITPQQKQQAQQKFQEYVNTTGKQDIQGFKEFVRNKTKGDYETKINKKALNESTDSDVFHYPFDEVYDELDQSEPTGEFEDTFDSEFETNSKKLDKIILNRYLKIQKSLERQKDKLVSEFNKIENTNDFTKDAEIYFDKHKELISEINVVEEKLKRIKAVIDAIFDKKDITSVVIAESNLIIDDINKLLKSENISPAELDYYYNLTKLLEEIHDENLKQEDSSLFTNASSEDLNQLKKLKNTFSNLNNDLLELLRKNINIKNDPIKDAKLFSQWFLKVGDYTNDILKKAESMISKSLFNITKFLNKELEAIKELHLKADSDFKRTGKQNNKFDIFFDKNKRIVQVFNYEYTDAAAKLYNAFRFASKDSAKSKRLELIRFHKQHSILLNAKYLFPDIYEHLTGTKVSAEEINKNIALYKSYLDDYTFEKMKSKVYKQTIKYLSKRDNDFFMSNMPFDENSLIQEFLTYIPKDKSNYNDKYSKIVQNDNLRNVYDKFMDLFNELKLISQGTTRSNLNKGFLPFLEKTMIENLSDFSFSTELGKFKQSILSSYDQLKNNSGQTVSNQVENPLKTVNDGLRSFLETKANDYYKQEKINLIYFLAHKKLTTNSAKLITEKFGPGFPSKKAEEIIESWTKEYFTSLEDTQTNDIQVLMNLMAQTVTSYKQKQAIESNLNLIKIAFDNQAVGEFDILGNLVGTNPTKKGRETKLAELLEVTINHFFGKNVQKPQLNDFLKRINNVSVAKQEELNKLVKEINENKELTPNEKIELEKALQNKFKQDSKYVDLDKINDKLLQYLRVLFLGWSPKSAFFNAAMGHIGNYMETIDGRIVDSKDLSAGVKMLFGKEKKKIQKLIANLSLIEDITKDFKKTTEESLHNEKWKNFKPERLQQIVEKSNQSPLIAALLNKSFNGVRIIDMIDESGNFLPQYEEYEYKFVNTAKYLIEKVHGPYDSNRIIMAETTSLGKNVIFMKKWMITSFFMKRFGSFDEKPREDLLMDYQFKGTYITLADVFNTMSNDQSGQRNYLLGIMKTMKAIALSDQSLTEVDKANLRSVRADLLIIGALLIAQQLVKYMLSDDDDDHEGLVFLLNTFFRIETELGSHYFLIDTFEGLAKNTIPQLDVYNRLEKIIKSFDENARISPAIRLAQMVPALNSGVSLYNFFNQQILYNR